MLKKKHSKIKIVLTLVLTFVAFANFKGTYAALSDAEKKEIQDYVSNYGKFLGCTDNDTDCKNKLKQCKSKLTNKLDWNESKQSINSDTIELQVDRYTIKTSNGSQEKEIDSTSEPVKFKVYVSKSYFTKGSVAVASESSDFIEADTSEFIGVGTYETGQKISIDTDFNPDKYSYARIEVRAVLDSEYKVDDVQCKGRLVLDNIVKVEDDSVDTFDNPAINGICKRYFNGALSDSELEGDNNAKYKSLNSSGEYAWKKVKAIANGEESFKELLPYCFQDKVQYVYNDAMVLGQIYNAAQIVINRSKISSVTLPVHNGNDGFTKIEYKNGKLDLSSADKIDLYCDAKSTSNTCDITDANVRKFYAVKEIDEKMVYHYTDNATNESDVCTTRCVEELIVSYGPPVAVKAGMCFEYEVKVESKVTCDYVVKGELPKLSNYKWCTPNPICNSHGAYYYDQGGPKEEFDQCVKELDGGKYTQGAINKCYKKVYGNKKSTNKNKMSLALSDSAVTRMTESWCSENAKSVAAAEKIYYKYQNEGYNGGFYYRDSNGIGWTYYDSSYTDAKRKLADGTVIKAVPGCYWNEYSRYYFLNYTKGVRTVLNDKNNHMNYADGGDRVSYWKYIPKNGFKVGSVCNEKCVYYTSHCPSGAYLNYFAPKGYSSAYNAYIDDLKLYNEKIAKCSAAAKCDQDTATYTITVNKSGSGNCKVGDSGKNCVTWKDTNKNNQCEYNSNVLLGYETSRTDASGKLCTYGTNTTLTKLQTLQDKNCSKIRGDSPIKEASGQCTNVTDKTQDYRTILTFPGSWINNKNGKVEFVEQTDKYAYTVKPGKFCVPINASSVNCEWFNWDQNGRKYDECLTTESYKDRAGVTINKYNGTYNILARVVGFGYLHWNIDINCFYAVSSGGDDSCSSKSSSKDGEKGNKCTKPPTGDLYDYSTKAAALDELFPSTDSSTSGVSNKNEKAEVKKLGNVLSEEKGDVTKVVNSSTSREVGFNWSCDATNLKNEGYPVTPTALIRKIQDKSENVYNDASELDYEIDLSVNQLSKIRNDFKNKDYNDYSSSSFIKNDKNSITFYQSPVLRNKSYATLKHGPARNSAAIKCNNMISTGTSMRCDYLKSYASLENACTNLSQDLDKLKD